MTGLVDWAAARARMVVAFVVLSLLAGGVAYVSLPKEGEPDIEIPALFVSVPFPGISAEDSEKLLVKVMETELSDLDGLDKMTGTAAENYAGVALEFEFGWDKTKIMADVRDSMNAAEAKFPAGAEKYTINEINFSEFPIIIVNLTGDVPERKMTQLAKNLQDRLEGLEPVLEAGIAGSRDEMVEIVIDPLRMESYNVTATELISVVQNNNQLIAAGEVTTGGGSFAVKILSSFDKTRDIYRLPIKTNGDRQVLLGELATINLTFEDRTGTARFNGDTSVALQVVKRKGFNVIDTADLVRETVEAESAKWPDALKAVVKVGTSNDQSRIVGSMVRQLEGSVLTAIALVMIVVLAALGIRPALLVGFAIPTSFLLCFAMLAVMDITISNMVMFGLILAVGMLVDGAIVVVEYADKRIDEGAGPMHAYVDAAKRMFWPVVSSTATTLCAFLPMLFWPGVPGQFMGMLPVTLIFVLSASLLVALVYLPVLGGVTGRVERWFNDKIDQIAGGFWLWHILLFPVAAAAVIGAGALIPALLEQVSARFAVMNMGDILGSVVPVLATVFALLFGAVVLGAAALAGVTAILLGIMAVFRRVSNGLHWAGRKILPNRNHKVRSGYRRSAFGWLIHAIAGNPVAPLLAFCAIFVIVGSTLIYYIGNNNGTEFFVETEPERAIVYVRGRGNLSIDQKDALVREVEQIVLDQPGIQTAFAFAGEGGLDSNTGGAMAPLDTIGQIQFETIPWEDRETVTEPWAWGLWERQIKASQLDGDVIIRQLTAKLEDIPGIKIEILADTGGPASAKPVHLRLKGDNWEDLQAAALAVRAKFEDTTGLTLIEDTMPLPGIDWQIDVDVEKAGRFGADVATVGAMVQLVTRGVFLDTMRVPSSDEEIDIRVRLPAEYRVLSTLDTLRVRTNQGLVPLSNFITRKPVQKLAQIDRIDQQRYFDVKAGVETGLFKTITDDSGNESTVPITANERIETLSAWLADGAIPASVAYEWTGDQEDQEESGAFLQKAFLGALGLMFIILLAQFNSVYNAVLVLLAVVLSTTGVLIGMLVMGQTFSIIMTGTGIVALAGIVVNNNIVLIDTYQEFSRYMPRIEAITRTAEARIRPVLLTTITTMAGLAPMMFGLSLDFINGGYSFDSPTALWWKQLATAVVFGLGIATVLTLVFTPSMLALRVWAGTYVLWISRGMAALSMGRSSRAARDWALARAARRVRAPELIWDEDSLAIPEKPVMRSATAATASPEASDTPMPPPTMDATLDVAEAQAPREAANDPVWGEVPRVPVGFDKTEETPQAADESDTTPDGKPLRAAE
ncbi:efflux RND transporter permease subunit [Roseovarius pelagicus]|uniref:Efflux RND transporter permease subunit n=1 Tax=Roseovarius pelagicus TaxID=2980108 RepID=A0ABY6DDS0_9RHOB|nr:efflux RND transporter permease subunit [Roseovarius pelagicus]UXX83128.1 efflux RND transporter permease subunit [Roseovarius pelagicus]